MDLSPEREVNILNVLQCCYFIYKCFIQCLPFSVWSLMPHTVNRGASTPTFSQFILVYHVKSPQKAKTNPLLRLISSSIKPYLWGFSMSNGSGWKNVTCSHGRLSVKTCAFEEPVFTFGANSGECSFLSAAWADLVIQMMVNEVCQERRRIQRDKCLSFLQRQWRWRCRAGRPLFSISRLLVLHLLLQQKVHIGCSKGH